MKRNPSVSIDSVRYPAMFLLVVILLGGLVGSVTSAYGITHQCRENPAVRVEAPEKTDFESICTVASRAITFLAAYDLPVRRTISIDIVEELEDNVDYIAYGRYDSRSDRISLMTYEAILGSSEKPTMYGEPFDEEHYLAAVAHEVAHAVVQHNMQVKPLSPSPQEYLAHATQLAVLSEDRRNRIIARTAVQPWLPGDTISDVYMAIEPTSFAVKSYLHLTSLRDPVEFVKILLNAKWFYVYVPD